MTDFPYDIGASFGTEPSTSTTFFRMPVNRDVTIASTAAVVGVAGTLPTSTYDILVKDGATTIGTISITTGGVFSYTAASGDYAVSAGTIIEFVSPGSADGTIADVVFGLQTEQSITVSGGAGGTRVLSEQTVSGASEVVFDNLDGRRHHIIGSGVSVATDGTELIFEVSTDNGSTWKTANYINAGKRNTSNSSNSYMTSTSAGVIATLVENTKWVDFHLAFAALADTSIDKQFSISSGSRASGGAYSQVQSYCSYEVAADAINAIRIRAASGNISGTFALIDVDAAGGGSTSQEQVASASSELVFTDLEDAEYELRLVDIQPATLSAQVWLQVSDDNGSSWKAANYKNRTTRLTGSSSTNTDTGHITLTDDLLNTDGSSGCYAIMGIGGSGKTSVTGTSAIVGGGGAFGRIDAAGEYSNDGAMNAIRIFLSSGNITSGKAILRKVT